MLFKLLYMNRFLKGWLTVCLSVNELHLSELRHVKMLSAWAQRASEVDQSKKSIRNSSANSVEFRGIRPRMYIDDLL